MRQNALTAALLTVALSAAPAEAGGSLRIDVDSADGDDVHVTLGTGLVAGLVRAFAPVSIDCDENRRDDPKVRELFRGLDRAGEPSRGTVDTGDDRLDARRRDGKLFLTVTDDDGEVTELEMPWTLARCVLGGERISGAELARALDSAKFEIRVDDGDDWVHIKLN